MATPYDSNKGKYARTDQIYFKIRTFDENTFGVRLKHPTTNQPPTAGQKAAQDMLTLVAGKVKTELADASKRANHKIAWKAQRKYKTLWSYVFHKLYEQEKGGA